MSLPKLLLHLEGAVVLVSALAVYVYLGASGWLFAVLLLAPDVSALGYLAGPRVGSTAYNLAHTYAWPALLLGIGFATGTQLVMALGLIWAAHIGMDRLVGYGFKYPSGFKDTHLGRV
jgi:Domain of unknown function (DUF4260)